MFRGFDQGARPTAGPHAGGAPAAGPIAADYRRSWLPVALAYPPLVLVVTLILLPVGYEVALSFVNFDAFGQRWGEPGLTAYRVVLTDPRFYVVARNTVYYALVTTALQLALGCTAAWLAFRLPVTTRLWLRVACFLPYISPTVSTVLVFDFLFDGRTGGVTYALGLIGIQADWHSEPYLFWLLVLISTWQYTPFVFVIVLARLEAIPRGLLDAAAADGAPTSQMLQRVILPQIRDTLFATVLLRFVFMFTKFDTPWLLAGARGTNRYVETLPVYSFRLAFERMELSSAAACGILLFAISAAGILLLTTLSSARSRA